MRGGMDCAWVTVVIATGAGMWQAACRGDELPTYRDARSTYQQNVFALMPFSVEWDVTEREFEAAFSGDLAAIPELKKVIDSGGVAQEHVEQVKASLAAMETRVSPDSQKLRLSPRTSRQFFWTDGVRFQFRRPQRTYEGKEPLDGSAAGPSAETFLTDFRSVNVFTYVPGRDPGLRMWLGLTADGITPSGLVSSKNLRRLQAVPYPPLGSVRLDWGSESLLSSADKWAGLPTGAERSEKGEAIRGDSTLLIRYAYGGGLDNRIDRVVIWLALEKGFVPIRIRKSFSGGELTVDPDPRFPERLYETVEVEGIDEFGGRFYPRRITTTRYAADRVWAAKQTEKVLFTTEVPMIPVHERIESVTRLRPDRVMPEESLALAFPVGTRYQDEDTGEWYLEGTPKKEFDRQLARELTGENRLAKRVQGPATTRPLRWDSPFVLLNLGVIIVLAVIYSCSRLLARRLR